MEQLFTTIQYRLPDKKVATFLNYLDQRCITQYDNFFIFTQEQINHSFQTAIEGLVSEITISKDYLQLHHLTLVSMTIDGDFILGNDSETYVIESTLIEADIEKHPVTVIDFFVSYENQTLQSQLIPTSNQTPVHELWEKTEESKEDTQTENSLTEAKSTSEDNRKKSWWKKWLS
ncbi:hypothetical protein [Vagococcus humatus]|uniref:Uncharacterized protein n=1 Tax=Vagococcus humatus TaxID=1889241 RepID=A0A3R9YEM0_9ENTE|nr:hypothetical protein [Vagococcus humatus]RST89485.1 hypothetical protein C7P63_06875 [Vagococcus humatus]